MNLSFENLRKYMISIVPATAIIGVVYVYWEDIANRAFTHDLDHTIITKLRFFPLTPPSNLRGPGTIYLVADDGQPESALCMVAPELLDKVLKFSSTQTQTVQQSHGASFAIGSDLEKRLRARVKGGMIQSVTFSLEDVSVHEISIADLRMLSREMQKVDDCAAAIEQYLKAGKRVCQGQQGLKATARYSVRVKKGADTSAAIDAIVAAVQATTEAKTEFDGSQVTLGVGLFYGMRLAPLCHYLPNATPPEAPVAGASRT